MDPRVELPAEVGSPRAAVRWTAAPVIHRLQSFWLSRAQKTALETFGETTLYHWTQVFDWVDPWPSAGTRRFRFLERPTYQWPTKLVPLPSTMPSNQVYRAGGAATQRLCQARMAFLEFPWLAT